MNGNADKYQVTAKADAQHWTISPPVVRALPDRIRVVMTCQGNYIDVYSKQHPDECLTFLMRHQEAFFAGNDW